MFLPTVKLVLSYDGTGFSGFQRQENAERTVQGVFETVFSKTFHEQVVLHGSGRTDAGVHARRQVAHITIRQEIPPDRIRYALNRCLPKDLVVVEAEEAPRGFHARKSAVGKAYSYRIFNGRVPPAIGHAYFCHIPQPLDRALMIQSLCAVLGHHSFKGFCAHGSSVKTFERTVHAVDLDIADHWWTIRVLGDGFLRKMVRNIVGSAIDVAGRRKPPALMTNTLASGLRSHAGQTAPPEGLFLDNVFYTQEAFQKAVFTCRFRHKGLLRDGGVEG